MKKILLFILLAFTLLFGDNSLKIATYNVENLFDLKRNGNEYKEYIPYTKSQWNQKSYNKKLNNLTRVIKDIDADIIALEEIESYQALKDLRTRLQQKGVYYPYYKIANAKNTTVKVALLSKIPFVYAKELWVTHSNQYRNILEVKFKYKNQIFYLFINHWKSKSGPESMRIRSAKTLMKRVKELGDNSNIIVVGDFNSDYEEYIRFKHKRKHNDTYGRTGINHILGTINNKKDASDIAIKQNTLYNLWYDIEKNKRYTYIYKGKKEALDSILVSAALLDKEGMEYKINSLHPFEKHYLLKRRGINRWQMSWKRPRKHLQRGYSDHLPLVAEFVILNSNTSRWGF
jgi:predicted extracellular nuclease